MRAQEPLPTGIPRYQDRFLSAGGITVAYDDNYTKQHVIEGDGLCPLIYQHLYKNTKGREHALSTVRLPETVVFDHNFPRAWYTYDEENKAIAKRSSKMLDAQTMFQYFSKPSVIGAIRRRRSGAGRNNHTTGNSGAAGSGKRVGGADAAPAPPRECDIVAQFFYTTVPAANEWQGILTRRERSSGRYDGQLLTYVEFFTAEALRSFLFSQSRKPDGVLQKFVVPKSEGTSCRSAQLHVAWSPLLSTVYRRTSRHRLDDTSLPPAARASTYDGPRWHSDEAMAADESRVQLTGICEDIAAHFRATEGKDITRLSLFFKADDRNNLWLLWCGGVRVAADSLSPAFLRVPLAADMRTEAANEGSTTVAGMVGRRLRQKQLLALDAELYRVTRDVSFAMTVNAAHKRQANALGMTGMRAGTVAGGGGGAGGSYDESVARYHEPHRAATPAGGAAGASPAHNSRHPLYPSFQRVWSPEDAEREAAAALLGSSGGTGGGGNAIAAARYDSSAVASRRVTHNDDGFGIGGDDAADVQARVLSEVVALAMDAWYAIYSTTLADDPAVMPTRIVAVAAPLVGALSREELDALTLDILGLAPVGGDAPEHQLLNRGGGASALYAVAPMLLAPGRRLDRPSAQVERELTEFLTELFAYRGPEIVRACLEGYAPYFEDI